MSTHYLVKRGLLEQRSAPSPHVIAKCTTYKHPSANLHATLYLTSNVGLTSFWQNTRYNLPERFDRIICEDGDFPVAESSLQGQLSKNFLRRFLPMFPHRMTYKDQTEFNKYKCMNLFRDTVESRMAFESVKRGDEPVIDPRARRVCEALNRLANNELTSDDAPRVGEAMPAEGGPLHVALPWHMYHAPYIQERLLKEGWTVEGVQEETMATRGFMMKVMLIGTWVTIAAVWILARMVVGLLFGWW